jgi:hypothetical protein
VSSSGSLFLATVPSFFYQGVQAERQRVEQGGKKKRPKIELRSFL